MQPGQGLAMSSASYGLHHIRNRIFTLQINAEVGNMNTFRVESGDHRNSSIVVHWQMRRKLNAKCRTILLQATVSVAFCYLLNTRKKNNLSFGNMTPCPGCWLAYIHPQSNGKRLLNLSS